MVDLKNIPATAIKRVTDFGKGRKIPFEEFEAEDPTAIALRESHLGTVGQGYMVVLYI
jgi:hypothetical protein